MKIKYQLLPFAILFAMLFSSIASRGQNSMLPDFNYQADDWFNRMQNPDVPFNETRQAFHRYFIRHDSTQKGNGYKMFKRWEYIHESRVLPNGKLQAPGYVMKQYDDYMASQDANSSAGGNWTITGPTAYPTNNTGQPTGMGRINAIAFHPTDASTIYIGAPSGGLWKTTNPNGNSTVWTNLCSNLPTLGISSILVNPADPNIIYAGTGDRDAGDAPGIGVYKTTDGGNTWSAMTNGMGLATVGAMVMHPSDPNTIIAATSTGIYKSVDGGSSWSKKVTGNFKDIKFKPGDPSIVYAVKITTPAEFYRSTDTGNSWTKNTTTPTSGIGSRMVIGVSAANPAVVYLVQIKSDNTFSNLLRSTDSGLNFSTMASSPPNIMSSNCDGSGTTTQADYDLCIAVDPSDINIVYVGGVDIWKSTNGGATWAIHAIWAGNCSGTAVAVHADHHVFEWSPINGLLYNGNDGGLYVKTNGANTWTELTGGLPITQVYKIGQGASSPNYTLFGCQDNGSSATINGSTFYTTRGGDGMETLIDYANSNYCYNTYVNGAINRTSGGPTGSYSYSLAGNGINGIDETGAWVTPYVLHKTDHLTMFAGYKNVWRSNNVTSTPPTWTKISSGETGNCIVVEQSAADPGVLYAVRSGVIKRTDNANDAAGSVTWSTCTLPGGYTPADLKTHPTDANIVYASAGYGVYKSTDKGATWTNITANLPSLFTNCLAYDKNSNEGLYVGNQTGVWYKTADMTNWMLYSTGLPPVDVRELEIYYDASVSANNTLNAGTYGRGVWKSSLATVNVIDPTGLAVTATTQGQISLAWTQNAAGNDVMIVASTTGLFGVPEDGTAYAAGSTLPSGGGTVVYRGPLTACNHASLSSNTVYYYKAWSVNGSDQYSAGVTPVRSSTECTPVSSLPYSETFDNPACWRVKDNTGQGVWQFGITYSPNYTPSMSGNYAFFKGEYGISHSYNTDLISPIFDLSSYSTALLTFDHLFDASSSYASSGNVSYSIDNGASWTTLGSYTTDSPSNPTQVVMVAGAAAGHSQVKFKWNYTCSPRGAYIWAVDNVKLTECQGVWTGAVSTNWHTSGNWCNNSVPSATTDVIIPPGVSNMPDISTTSVAYCRDISILSGASLKMSAANSTLEVKGNWTMYGSLDEASSSSSLIKFNGSTLQSIGGTTYTIMKKCAVDNSSGVSLSTELRVDNNLNLINGLISTIGSGKVNIFGGSVSRTNGWVNGTLQKYTWTNPSSAYNVTYEIGDATTYTPVSFSFPAGSITAGGGFSVKTTSGDYSAIASSTLNGLKSVNRYWSFPLIGITFSSCSATLSFVSGDLDATTVTSNLIAGKYASSAWTYPTVGTRTSTTTQVTGLASAGLGDIQLAEGPKSSIAAGGNWSNAATWSPSGVPVYTDNTTITASGTVQVDITDAATNNLTIQSGAVLQVNPAKAVTISGTLTNGGGTTSLVVKSDASGTGSIIHSTSEVDATFERYMNNADWTNWKDGWHFLSSPMAAQPIAPAFTSDPYDFYCWYEPTNQWVNYKNSTTAPTWNTANGSTDFVVGKGYLVEYDEEGVKSFTGKLNVSDVSVQGLTITAGGANNSWHLLGNPFGSALNWDASADWNLTNIGGVAKIWNEVNQSYSDLASSPSSTIPATNGFMVYISSGTGSLVMPAAKRIHSAVPFYKSTQPALTMKVTSLADGSAQESRIIINPSSTNDFDLMYDGVFLPGYAPEFCAFTNQLKLSTNSIPGNPLPAEIPYRFVKTGGSDYRLEATGAETIDAGLYLHDLKTATVTDLKHQSVYLFSSSADDSPGRFLLAFRSLGTDESAMKDPFTVYPAGDIVYITNNGKLVSGNVMVYNMIGQEIVHQKLTEERLNKITLNGPTGYYLVRIITGGNTLTTKIFKAK